MVAKKIKKTVSLDSKDLKILAILSANARVTHSSIAKKVGLTREGVAYRIKGYEKSGLIRGYRALINTDKFGLQNFHTFLRLKTPVQDSDILKSLKESPYVSVILAYDGSYDLELLICAKDASENQEFFAETVKSYEEDISHKEVIQVVQNLRVGALPNSILKPIIFSEKKEKEEFFLDEKDLVILKCLTNNARMPLHEISTQINLSADAVGYRLKKLENRGFINAYIPLINYNLLDFDVYTILVSFYFLDEKSIKQISEYLSNEPAVLWGVRGVGNHNLIIDLASKDSFEIHNSIRNFKNLFPDKIKEYNLLFQREMYKGTYFPEIIQSKVTLKKGKKSSKY